MPNNVIKALLSAEQKDPKLARINRVLSNFSEQDLSYKPLMSKVKKISYKSRKARNELNDKSSIGKVKKTKIEEPKYENKLWKYIGSIGIIIGIFAGIAEFSGFSIKDLIGWQSDSIDYFDITVFVHGKKGKHEQILENKGKVVIELKTDRRDEKIGDKGEVNFKQLPNTFRNKLVTFYIIDTENEPYQVTKPKAEYKLVPNESIYLEVTLANLNQLKGIVRDKDVTHKRLPGVKVCIEDTCVETNNEGRFLLLIPEKLQRKFHTVTFQKEGYEEYIKHNTPMQTIGDLEVGLISLSQ